MEPRSVLFAWIFVMGNLLIQVKVYLNLTIYTDIRINTTLDFLRLQNR
jgi:hypothetical protein